MGAVASSLEEEKLEHDLARERARDFLDACTPEFITDLQLHGLAPEGHLNEKEEFEALEHDDASSAVSDDEGAEVKQKEEANEKQMMMISEDRRRFLANAASGHHWRMQKLLRKQHVKVGHKDKHGRTALHIAAERGHPKSVDLLLQCHADVDSRTNDGWTPLHSATFHGQVKCMESLLEAEASVSAKDRHGCTPLILSAASPKLYCVDLVSKPDRAKRKLVRIHDEKTTRDQSSRFFGSSKGNAMLNKLTELVKDENELSRLNPTTLWTYYPNRIELIAMDRLLSRPRAQVNAADNWRRTALIYAARYGRVYAVSRLLAAKANVSKADLDERTALFHAASNAHVETVVLLLSANASVRDADGYFRTPLHAALEAEEEGMVNLLIHAEANVNAYDCDGSTPIMLAMDQGNRRIFGHLLEHKSSLAVVDKRGWNVVIYAIETNMFSEVLPILQKLGDDDVKLVLRSTDPEGRNALHHAVMLPRIEDVNRITAALISFDSDAACYGDCNGDTPLHVAAELGRLEALRLMSDGLESVDFLNNRGETPLHYAAHGGHMACVLGLLRDEGKGALADADLADVSGNTLLMQACISGHLDLVNLLLQNRHGRHPELAIPPLDVNAQNEAGATALLIAVREGHWQLIPSLVLGGCNVASVDEDGYTALHIGAVEDEVLVVSQLLELALDADAKDKRGWTPLMYAVQQGHDEVVRLLLDSTADMNVRNFDGDTALQLCLRRQDEGMVNTRDILLDGVLGHGQDLTRAFAAQGHFMVTILSASDLFLDERAGVLNPYVCVQFSPRKDSVPQVAFTTCVLNQDSPTWHEVFRFDVEELDTTAYLVAWVLAAPGEDKDEIVQATAMGVPLDRFRQAQIEAQRRGIKLPAPKGNVAADLDTSFKRVTRRAEYLEDKDINRLRAVAMASELDAVPPDNLVAPDGKRHRIPVDEKMWVEVSNLRHLLRRSGCDLPEPLAPRSHIPLGCIVMRFRHLREAVWGTEPVEMDRHMRMSIRGNLRLEVDFRPRFFRALVEGSSNRNEEDDEVYQVSYVDSIPPEDLEAAAQAFQKAEEERALLGDPLDRALTRLKPKDEAEKYYKGFRDVMMWSNSVLTVKRMLEEQGPTPDTTKKTPHVEKAPQKANVAKLVMRRLANRVRRSREWKARRQDAMDQQIRLGDDKARPAKKKAPVKDLEAQPWLDDLIQNSRFM